MASDLSAYKAKQPQTWAGFGAMAALTLPASAHLVRFASIRAGDRVLDVGTGTGNAAITAALEGAHVTGLDITPELLVEAKQNAETAGTPGISWREGDAESMPFEDASFDTVISQFGHMFAPRPELAVSEMLRVLKPGGRIVFATWPASSLPGRVFDLAARHLPPPAGVPAVTLWGEPEVIRARLGDTVRDVRFERGSFGMPTWGAQHFMAWQSARLGPMQRMSEALARDPARLAQVRGEYLALIEPLIGGNLARHDYLATRATKR